MLSEDETTEFRYETGLLKRIEKKKTTVVTGKDRQPVTISDDSFEEFEYDGQDIATRSVRNDSDGSRTISEFKNGIINLATSRDKNGVIGQIVTFDEKGNAVSHKMGTTEYVVDFDSAGNLLEVKTYDNKVLITDQIFRYDDKPNPETLMSTTFKGIPIRLNQSRRFDGVNNMVNEKFENIQANFRSEYTVGYTYNSQGLPTESIGTNDRDDSKITQTFKYKNCD